MSDLTNYERIALETFLSEFDEPASDSESTFDILICDIENGFDNYTCCAADFQHIAVSKLAELIIDLAHKIKENKC